jgi:TPR repeat protein
MSAKTANLMSTHGRLWYDAPIYRASWVLAPQCIALVLLAWIFGAAPTNPSVPWGKPSAPPAVKEDELESLRDQASTGRDAMTRLESMAATGNPLSNFFMGTLYDPQFKMSKIVSPDVDKSITYYNVAANGGVEIAKENLMNFYFLPSYERTDWVKGCDLATDQTVRPLAIILQWRGYCYANGWGTTKLDLVKAVAAFRGGAELGDARSQAELGAYYATGEGNLPQDDSMAAKLYKQSADQKDLLGIYNLGSCYDRGCGALPKNPMEAARLVALALDSKFDVVVNILTTRPNAFTPQFWQELQRQLVRRNVYKGPLDGVPSPAVMSAIKRMGAAN